MFFNLVESGSHCEARWEAWISTLKCHRLMTRNDINPTMLQTRSFFQGKNKGRAGVTLLAAYCFTRDY